MRHEAAELKPDEFRQLGRLLVDRLATFLETMPTSPVSPQQLKQEVLEDLRSRRLPEYQTEPRDIIDKALDLVLKNSVQTGHPRFMGYICSSGAPIGALADLAAGLLNSNLASAMMAPAGTELERQTIRWIADLLGYQGDGGILVSGGNMANFVGVLVARRAKASWDTRSQGMQSSENQTLRVYAANSVHTWLDKALDCFGFGTKALHRIATDHHHRLDPSALERAILSDRENGDQPFLVIGSAGTVSCGAIDPLEEIAAVANRHGLWFHVDGAYGAPAVALKDADTALKGLRLADSVAVDPHKWMYVPIEAGCVLVREMRSLRDTFSFTPDYYDFSGFENDIHYYEYGLQNTRGFRALKIWMCLSQMGRRGLVASIAEDIRLSRQFFCLVSDHNELHAISNSLSITNFRFVPQDIQRPGDVEALEYVNELNRRILSYLRAEGEFFLTNAHIGGMFTLRVCIVNFRTTAADLQSLAQSVVEIGRQLHSEMHGPKGVLLHSGPTSAFRQGT